MAVRRRKTRKPSRSRDEDRGGRKKRRGMNRRKYADLYDQLDSGEFHKLQDGRTRVRILPNPSNPEQWYTPLMQIFVPPARKGEKWGRFISPRVEDSNAYCPATEASKALGSSGHKEQADQIYPRTQYVANAMLKQGKSWRYVKLQFPKTILKAIVAYDIARSEEEDEDEDGYVDVPDVADEEYGRVIEITRTTKNKRTDYNVVVTEKEIPAEQDWLDKCTDFDKLNTPSEVEEIEDAICEWLDIESIDQLVSRGKGSKSRYEDDDDDDFDDDDDDRRSRKRSRRDEEDDDDDLDDDSDDDDWDDDDDQEEDEEDEEEDRGSRRRSRGSKRSRRSSRDDDDDDGDDDGDDDEDDDDDDDEPRRGRSSRKRPAGKRSRRGR